MQVIVVEDEIYSAEKLKELLKVLKPEIEVKAVLTSVEECVQWLMTNSKPDLIFLDVHLSDGTSFEIFNQIEVSSPIIFTTAYDQYAIQAFKHNSIDYLLKPFTIDDLEQALDKFDQIEVGRKIIKAEILSSLGKIGGNLKKRFLVKKGSSFESIPVEHIAYFKSHNKLTYIVDKDASQFIVDHSLDQIVDMVSEEIFFKINRNYIVSIESIKEIHSYFNGRLKLELSPVENDEVLVSRDRASEFKIWLDS